MNEETTSACACAAPPRAASPAKRRAAPYCLALSLGLAALVPKCPLCLAAYLSLVGLSGGLAAYAHPLLRPLSVVFVALAIGGVLPRRAQIRWIAKRVCGQWLHAKQEL